MFMIGALIIAIAASAISVKTLVGYTEMRSVYKILISLLIVSAWFAPVIVSVIRATAWGNTRFFCLCFRCRLFSVRDSFSPVDSAVAARLFVVLCL